MIGKFFAGLSENGKKLTVIAVVIVVIALFDLLLIRPTMSRMATIDNDITKEESQIKQDLHFLTYKNRIIKESEALAVYTTGDLPTEDELIAAFLKKIEMLAHKANITLIKVTPSPGVKDKDYLKYQVDLEASGKLADVITFMHLVDTSNELLKVSKFNFSSKKSENDDLKASISIIKVIVGKDPAPAKSQETPAQGDGSAAADKTPSAKDTGK